MCPHRLELVPVQEFIEWVGPPLSSSSAEVSSEGWEKQNALVALENRVKTNSVEVTMTTVDHDSDSSQGPRDVVQ